MATLLIKITNTGASTVEEVTANTIAYFGVDHSAHFDTSSSNPAAITEATIHKSGGSTFTYTPSATLKIEVGYIGSRGVFDVLISS